MRAHACFSKSRAVCFACILALLTALPAATARADWAINSAVNNPVAVALNAQNTSVACTDGAGGAIIAWMDDRAGVGITNIWAQRFDADGNPLWGLNGIPICVVGGAQANPAITADGAGGAIIAWQDPRPGAILEDMYAQRVNAAGAIMWALNGVAVCAAPGGQIWPMLVSDGAGGAIIAWEDSRNAGVGDPMEIYAQHVAAATGVPTWIVGPPDGPGVPICLAPALQAMPMIVEDGAGGAIIAWYDDRFLAALGIVSIYARRVDAAGGLPLGWIVDGTQLCGPATPGVAGDRTWPNICTDGLGGAIVSWDDQRVAGDWNIYARRITIGGAMPAPWPVGGAPICVAPGNQQFAKIVSDGGGGALITWQDARAGAADINIFAQHVDINGAIAAGAWVPGGAPICVFPGNQTAPKIVTNGSSGAIIAWVDARVGPPTDIYAQRVSSTAAPEWAPTTGVPVSTAPGIQDWAVQYIPMVSDNNGGAILTWNDNRPVPPATPPEVYAQKIRNDGVLGDPEVVGYWRFEEGSGTSTADASGLGNNGTLLYNTGFTSTIHCGTMNGFANAFALNTGDGPFPPGPPYYQGVRIPDSPSLRTLNAITLEAWVRPHPLSPDLLYGVYGTVLNKQRLYSCDSGTCDTPTFNIRAGGSGLTEALVGGYLVWGPALPLDQWSHVAVTWDSQTQNIEMYIDFVHVATGQSQFPGPLLYSDRPLLIGADGTGPTGETSTGNDAEIDEVRISSRALTPPEMLHSLASCELAPVVNVWRPNANQDTLTVGQNFNIPWVAFDDGGVQSISLEYSFDGGVNYGLIASGEPNDSLYTWLVPDTPSDSCLVRVTAYDGDGNSSSAITPLAGYFWIVSQQQAIVTLSPSNAVVFINAPANTTTCQPLYVRNTGTATLNILGISGCGAAPFAIDTTMTDHSVAPGDTAEINVCVTPTANGFASCTIKIVSNAFNSHVEEPVVLDSVTGVRDGMPTVFRIVSVTPNPFNPETTVHFTLPRAMPVTADVWDVSGARVRSLARGQRFGPGEQQIRWDGVNDRGATAATGVYFIRLTTSEGSRVARAVLLK